MLHPNRIFGRLGNQMFQGAYIYAQMKRGRIPDIYVQDPVYFDDYIEDIKILYGDGIGKIDKVGIHVRRGDYVNNPFYTDLTKTDYYKKAMSMFSNEHFMVFSDDVEWCKKQDIFKGCSFSEGHDEIQDLNLLSSCKHQIIANSSFSLWSGILNSNPNKIIVCPLVTKYYSDGVIRTKYPKYFTQIDFKNDLPIK